MKNIENWLLILGLINIILFIISIIIFLPKKIYQIKISEFNQLLVKYLSFILIIISVVAIHLIEVNIIDQYTTNIVGVDFAENIQTIEDNLVINLTQYWTPILVYFFVIIYIGIYPFTLWFTPLYLIITDDKKPMKTFTYGFLLIYLIALPFYLFMPITNVYTFYGGESALNTVIPNIEQFFYSTTTHNNCLPSLHVAMSLLIAITIMQTKNQKYKYFTYFTAFAVIISVIYLAIHWITDVISGIILAIAVFYILKYFIKEK